MNKCETGTMKRVIPFIIPFKVRIFALIALTAVLSVLAMLPPLFTRALINDVIGEGRRDIFLGLVILIFAVPVLSLIIGYFQVVGIAYLGQLFVMRLRMTVYRHLLSLHMGFFGKHSTGKLINRIMGDSTTLQKILNVSSIEIVSDLTCSLFAILATFYINWRLAIPIFLTVFLFALNFRTSVSKIRASWRNYHKSEDRLAGGVQNRLVSNLTVKSFGMEDRENKVFAEQAEDTTSNAHGSWLISSNFWYNTLLLQSLGRIIIYFLGCSMILSGDVSYGDVTAFTTYAMGILWPAVRFSELAEQFQNAKISVDRLFEILDEEPMIKNKPNALHVGKLNGKVDFTNVCFSYEKGHPILNNLNFHVKPGETVALVGPTGCGKTTILSLIMRLFEIDSGAICIDDLDIRDINTNNLRSQFGIVLQESLLFTVSIADNIRYARPDAKIEEIIEAAKIAEIHNDILKLPNGYDSVIGDKDIQLSVGQKQRLSIARAVLANPSILIMDEATSSLDSESEYAIQQALERFLFGRTSFIVAHRLSTIRNADRILLLSNGSIIESGNHETLMSIPNGKYRELYEKHAGKGVISDESC